MKKFIVFALVLVLLSGCRKGRVETITDSTGPHETKSQTEVVETQAQDTANLQTTANQEELNEDAYRNFTSPDLQLFNLHGKVKSVSYSSKTFFPNFLGDFNGPINFDTEGKCTNIKAVAKTVLGNGSIQMVRNDKNQITKLANNNPYDDKQEFKLGWKDGRLSSYKYEYWEGGNDVKISYNNDLPKTTKGYGGGEGETDEITGKYSNFVFDDMGNWISCDYKVTTKSWFDWPADATYQHANYTIKRKITYYPR